MSRMPNSPSPRAAHIRRTAALSALVFAIVAAAVSVAAWTFRDDASEEAVVAEANASAEDTGLSLDETPVESTVAEVAVVETTIAPSTTTAPTTTPPVPDCPALDGSSPRVTSFSTPPKTCIDPKAKYSAKIETSEGDLTIVLDAKDAPVTVNNFVTLARFHFYDGLTFHRIIPGFIVQGGDPLGTGRGGPGYEFADGNELPKAKGYKVGQLAMANSGPDTNGSQFFIATGDLAAELPATYIKFATVKTGQDVLKAIDEIGNPPSEDGTELPPKRTVTIKSITIIPTDEKAERIPALASATAATPTTVAADATATTLAPLATETAATTTIVATAEAAPTTTIVA